MSYADQDIKKKSKFLKVEAGEPAVIRLLDADPYETMKHALSEAAAKANDGKFQVECKGDICPLCQDGDEPTQKWVSNIYNHTLQKVQLFEYGPMIAKQLKTIALNLAEENADIMSYDLKVEAEGAMLSKKYKVTLRTTQQPVPSGLVKLKVDGDVPF